MKLLIEFGDSPLATRVGRIMIPMVRCWIANAFDSEGIELPNVRLALVGDERIRSLDDFVSQVDRRKRLGHPLDVTVWFTGGFMHFIREDCRVIGGEFIDSYVSKGHGFRLEGALQ